MGYRYFIRQRAAFHKVAGFVRNLPDGSVEVRAEGSGAALGAFESDVRRGPSFARVEEATVTTIEPRGFTDFEIR